jgi:hypothetical protein
MKFNDLLNETQVNELGILKNIGGALNKVRSNMQASKLQSKGASHAGRIADNIRAEFQQMVGGGMEPTYQNLIDFLEDLGLSDLDTIPNPAGGAPSVATPPERIDPTMEAVAGGLNNMQIDKIIKDAVRKNYAKIVAAQQGRTARPQVEPTGSADPEPAAPEQPAPQATAPTKPVAPPTMTGPTPTTLDGFKKMYSTLDPKERAALRDQLDIIDDQDRLASGTNESINQPFVSKFLGIAL